MKLAGLLLVVVGISSVAMGAVPSVPEIGAASGVAALALLSGAVLVIRGRRKS